MNARVAKVAPFLFGSGTCALVYQIVWLREMRFIFGASTAASAAVLAIFMGGLGAGGIFLGRRADKHPRPLALYAQLELMIALSAALTPAFVVLARHAYIGLGGSVVLGMAAATAVRLILAALVLVVPTFLMGGTLPAAAKAVETDEDVSRRNLAVLYGVNTLGAVTGAFVSTFFLLESLGSHETLWLAAVINLSVALGAAAVARTMRPAVSAAAERSTPPPAASITKQKPRKQRSTEPMQPPRLPPASSQPARPRGGRQFVLIAAGVVGFAFLLMELVWYRMLAPLLGGTSFTFGLILAVALLGIGLGGAAYSLFGSSRRATFSAFALTCTCEAACIIFPYALGDRLALLALYLRPLGTLGFYGLVLGWTLVLVLAVLPAAFVAGVQFPLLIALLGEGSEHVGTDTGLAYAWNTVGAILGSLAGGFGLLPLLSAPGAWRVVVAILVALGLAAMALAILAERQWRRILLPLGAAVGAVFMLPATGPTPVWRHSAIGAGRAHQTDDTPNELIRWRNRRRRAVVWEAEGVESSVALDALDGYAFLVNGKIDGNSKADAATQVMAGLIGAILHPKPTRALVIGLGTGSTAGWLGAIPSMERVDVVELEPSILHVAKVCAPVNQNVLQNPKVHIFIGDAREVLLTTRERYDIIFSEPSNPYRAGISSLFTREFYQAVATRLADGGIFLQWLQAYEVDSQTLQMAYTTLNSVFPSVETWETAYSDLVLAATAKPIAYNVPALRAKVQQEPFKSALLTSWRTTGLEGLLSHFMAGPAFTQAVVQEAHAPLNTDDRTLLDFAFARSVGRRNLFEPNELRASARARDAHRPLGTASEVNWAAVDDELVNTRTGQDYAAELQPYFTEDQRLRATAQNLYVEARFEEALSTWRQQPLEPAGPVQSAVLAESLADAGDDAALKYIDQLRAYEPATADAVLGRLRWRQERLGEATDAFEAAFRLFQRDPWPLSPVMNRSLEVAADIATKDKALGSRLFDVLRTPFAAAGLNEARQATLLGISTQLDFEKVCDEVMAQYEPFPIWQRDFLSQRLRCYKATRPSDAIRAQQDLDAFTAMELVPFDPGRPSPPPTAAGESG